MENSGIECTRLTHENNYRKCPFSSQHNQTLFSTDAFLLIELAGVREGRKKAKALRLVSKASWFFAL